MSAVIEGIIMESIFARCVVRGECWEWTGARRPKGYGIVRAPGTRRNEGPHRVVMRCLGYDVEGKHVCHRCDNPSCCNPDHLFVGTAADNVRDCMAKGRFVPPPIGRRGLNAKGVSFHKRSHKYVARIQVDGNRVQLGEFKSFEAARAAYDAAALRHFGAFARRRTADAPA
jgi:hypothetical protein